MSKIEIINTYERVDTQEKIKDKDFYDRLYFINNNLNYKERYNNYNGFEGYGDLLILPDGYFPISSDYLDYTFITDNNNSLYKIIYFPGLEKDQENLDETSFIDNIPKQKIYLEREYILERAAFLTEEKYGYDKPNQLISALEEVQNGIYNRFTNRDHGREDLKQIPPEEIPHLMRQILYKYDVISKYDRVTESDVRELFTKKIKFNVKKYREKNGFETLTNILSNMEKL